MTSRSRKPVSHSERGYILITLLLFVALITIAAVVMAPLVAFQVKRDREEELIHRGVQYSRAMKHYVKKFGRYPTRIEDLENTNQVRFLRKRYKDPMTGKDFKILRMGDVQLASGGGFGGLGGANPLNPASRLPGGTIAQISGPGANGVPTTTQFAGGPVGAPPTAPGPDAGAVPGPNGGNQQESDENTGDNQNGTGPNQGGTLAAVGPGAPGVFGAVTPGGAPGSGQGPQVFGGGPMVGVASTSKDKSIRIFNKKDRYDQWMFIYDPSSDRGGLLTTPSQPSLQGATTIQQGGLGTPGAPGLPNPGIPGQPGQPPGVPTQPGMQTPQMPPDQEQEP